MDYGTGWDWGWGWRQKANVAVDVKAEEEDWDDCTSLDSFFNLYFGRAGVHIFYLLIVLRAKLIGGSLGFFMRDTF